MFGIWMAASSDSAIAPNWYKRNPGSSAGVLDTNTARRVAECHTPGKPVVDQFPAPQAFLFPLFISSAAAHES